MEKLLHNPKRLYQILLWASAILALVNLIFSVSVVALVGGIVIWIMVWGIHRGDYPLSKAMGIFFYIYAVINLIVLALVLWAGAEARVSAMIWLAVFSILLIVLGVCVRSHVIQDYLKDAEPPPEKQHRIHFFHGGWRDL